MSTQSQELQPDGFKLCRLVKLGMHESQVLPCTLVLQEHCPVLTSHCPVWPATVPAELHPHGKHPAEKLKKPTKQLAH